MLILNAFSLNMLPPGGATIKVDDIDLVAAAAIAGAGVESAVGHADTANVFASVLGVDVPVNRVSVMLTRGQTALVGQYSGPRLPEGATTLPEGATIRWMVVTVV